MGRRNGLRRPNSGKIYCKAGRADCGNDFSNMLQASLLIVYKYMLNVNIRVDLSEKLCYPYYWLLFTPFTVTRFAMHRNHAKHDFALQFSGFL